MVALVGLFVLVGGQSAEVGLDAPRVVPPVDVANQGVLGLGAGRERRARPVHELDLEGGPQVLRERVVEAVPDRPGGWGRAGVDEAPGEPQRGVLRALVAVEDQLPGVDPPGAQRVVQRGQPRTAGADSGTDAAGGRGCSAASGLRWCARAGPAPPPG